MDIRDTMRGPRLGTSSNPVHDTIVILVQHEAPPSALSPAETTNASQQELWLAIKESVECVMPEGFVKTLEAVQRNYRDRSSYLFPTACQDTFPHGVVGVSADALTMAVLKKHIPRGWRYAGHDFVRMVVLPSLVALLRFANKARGLARWTHRKFFQCRQRPTDEGLIEQQRLADRSGLRTWLVRVRACNRVLVVSTQGSTSLEIIFRTIEKGVNKACWHYFGDPTGHFHRTWDDALYVLAGK